MQTETSRKGSTYACGWIHPAWEIDNLEEDVYPESDPDILNEWIGKMIDTSVNNIASVGLPVIAPVGKQFGMEVGDDRATLSRSTVDLALMHIIQDEVFDMITSKEDTFISKVLYNLAETTSIIPRSHMGSFNHARKSGQDFKELEFVDDSALRVLMDVLKGNKTENISTAVGKSSFLRSRIKSRPEVAGKMQIASFFQDGMLSTARTPDPKYLPSAMGGIGVPPLFNEPMNIYLYVKSFRGGAYERVYGSATAEAMSAVNSMDSTRVPESLKLCSALRMKQMYLHATYDEKVAVPERSEMYSLLPPPLYKALGPGTGATAVESRLVRAKILLGRRAAETELTRKSRYDSVIFGAIPKTYMDHLTKVSSKERSKAYGSALQANTAFANLLNRTAIPEDMDKLLSDGFSVVYTGERKFMMQHALWISDGCRGIVSNLADITTSEDMFFREDVSCEESLKISDIPLLIKSKGKIRLEHTKTKVGLYEIGSSQEEWATNLGLSLRNYSIESNGPIPGPVVRNLYYENREWVTDDLLIVGQVTSMVMGQNLSDTSLVVLVSTDKKLAQRTADSANVTVALLHPVSYRALCDHYGFGPNDQRMLRHLPFVRTFDLERAPVYIIVDSGSSLAHLSKREVVRGKPFKKEIISVGRVNGYRSEKYSMTEDNSLVARYSYVTYANKNRSQRSRYSGSTEYRKAHSVGSVRSASESYSQE